MDLLLSTLRTLRAHALRFALTSLGIVWGAFMLTFLSASMQGLDDHFTREMEEVGPKLVIVYPGAVLKNRVGQRGARSIELENEDIERLAELQSIEDATPDFSLWSQIVRAGPRTKLFNVNGVSPASGRIRNLVPAEGRFFTPLDVERGARVAYLGAVARKRLFGASPAVGRQLQIESLSFRVVGVNEPKGDQMIGVNGWDDWSVFVPWSTAQRWLSRSDKLTKIAFAPLSREGSWDAIGHARQVLGLHHDFQPDLDSAVSFFNIHEVLQIVHQLIAAFRFFLVSAGIITLLVGAVGVMNIMLVVVGERTNEIGLRKAVGAGSAAIFTQFLVEAGAVCTLSGLVGAGLGVALTKLVAAYTPPELPFSTPMLVPFDVAVIVVALAAVGVVAGVWPALRASRIDPAVALRA